MLEINLLILLFQDHEICTLIWIRIWSNQEWACAFNTQHTTTTTHPTKIPIREAVVLLLLLFTTDSFHKTIWLSIHDDLKNLLSTTKEISKNTLQDEHQNLRKVCKWGNIIYICKEKAIKLGNKYTQTMQTSKPNINTKHFNSILTLRSRDLRF